MTSPTSFNSPIGQIVISCSQIGISRVVLTGQSLEGFSIEPDGLLIHAKSQVLDYLTGTRKVFDLPLDWSFIKGFQLDALKLAMEIPYGEVRTYGQIADKLGIPKAGRAVGGAMSRNPLPLLIPCHRVISSSGKLTGYTGANGTATKKWLLELEGHRIDGEKLV